MPPRNPQPHKWRKAPSNEDTVQLLLECLDSQGWAIAITSMAGQIRKVRERILTGGSSNADTDINTLRTIRVMLEDVYKTAGIDMPTQIEGLFS